MHEKERGVQDLFPVEKHSIFAEILIRLLDELASGRQSMIRTWQTIDIFPASERTLGSAISICIKELSWTGWKLTHEQYSVV